ncbi:MAG: hypothetical protein HY736_08860 [Verrucomicrobia bacterium]|nr:hypothetical protein [Verrucomicrobiota bacterium]
MSSHTVFEDFGHGRNRLEHPGYWQNRLAVLFFSPHFLPTHDYTSPARRWTAEKPAERAKNAG